MCYLKASFGKQIVTRNDTFISVQRDKLTRQLHRPGIYVRKLISPSLTPAILKAGQCNYTFFHSWIPNVLNHIAP